MEKVKLTYVRSEKKTSAKGNDYTSVGIKIESKPDTWINGFGNAQTEKWTEGDEFELDIYEEEYNGKMYWKFRLPKTGDLLVELTQRVECLEETVNTLVRVANNVNVKDLPDKSSTSSQAIVNKIEGEPEPIPPPGDDLPF